MASVAMLIGGAVVNALAFTGSSYLFRDKGEERKKYYAALESLQEAKERFNEQRANRIDFINKTLREQRHAEKTFNTLDEAMREYYEITKQKIPPLKEPKLSDFYTPSEKQKNGELLFIVGALGLTSVLLYKYV